MSQNTPIARCIITLSFAALASGVFACGTAGEESQPAPTITDQNVTSMATELAAGECADVCNNNRPCGFKCQENGSWNTCGGYGICCPWVRDSREEIGRYQKGRWYGCDYYVSYRNHEHLACSPGTTRVTCNNVKDGWGVNMDCCEAWGCWGQRCN